MLQMTKPEVSDKASFYKQLKYE